MARHIYVHIPFCEAKCPYCSFYSEADSTLSEKYFDALHYELDHTDIIEDINRDEVDTIYFGGGTPSSQNPIYIVDVLKHIIRKFDIDPLEAEITIEVNPHSLSKKKAEAYFEAGFNRVSVGVQSLHDSTLKTLGRLHDSKMALEAINTLKEAGFTNISADLIEGVPNQTKEEVLEDAGTLIELGVKHVSMYSLSIEEGTPFEKKYPKLYEIVPEEYEREMYHALRTFLNGHGIHSYEISNCARDGFESKHNSSYWDCCEYYAFGAGASGYLASIRFSHENNIKAYIDNPIKIIVEEALTNEDKMDEFAMLQLRKIYGINKAEFKERFGIAIEKRYSEILKKHKDNGFIEEDDGFIRFTIKGLDMANLVFEDFV